MKKGLLLLSSGIDSPVAGYIMMKKGIDMTAIHFDAQPFSDDKPIENVENNCIRLGISDLYIANHGKNHAELLKKCEFEYKCVLCRRFMFKISERLATIHGFDCIITGENIAQVASQTMVNMINERFDINVPILTPLLGLDKMEIIDIARSIGTYEISIRPTMCCNAVPKNPITKSDRKALINEEKKLDVEGLVQNAADNMKFIKVCGKNQIDGRTA